MNFISETTKHLTELRQRLLRCLAFAIITLIVLLQFTDPLYSWLAKPLMQLLPEGSSMIATAVTAPFMTPFKLVFYCTLLLTAPVALHQLWSFVVPGLYPRERRLLYPLLLLSTLLFLAGIAFAYWLVLPVVFKFFISATPVGVQVMTDITAYLDFVMSLFIAFGLTFQCPIVTCLVVRLDIVSRKTLQQQRPYIIVVAFFIGMLLTPPDVISQTLLAIPMWLLFEAGLLLSRFLPPAAAATPAVTTTATDEQ